MVEVIINGTSIDLISKGVKYIKQVNDLADISKVNTSFTYSIKADKTPRNTRLFQQLGMVGDTSTTPYVKNTAQLIDNGAVLISKGIATVKETNSEYKLFIQDGIVEVFKLIENKTLGNDLQLPELIHAKSATTIINSWGLSNPEIETLGGFPYRYLISDYNGKTNTLDTIDAAYQIPSVNVKYLWDKVFNYIGYTYSGDFNFINDKWITYPKPPEVEEGEILSVLTVQSIEYSSEDMQDGYKQWKSPTVQNGVVLVNNWGVRIPNTGNYIVTVDGKGVVSLLDNRDREERVEDREFIITASVNGQVVAQRYSNDINNLDTPLYIALNADEIFTIGVTEPNTYNETINGLYIEYLSLDIKSTAVENIDFQTALSKFSLKDFFKEVLMRGALTPFTDNLSKHIVFKNLKERLNTHSSNVVNLSSKFVRRLNESYTYGTYGQRNLLKLKYNNQEETFNDGYISVENKNIEDEKILFESKFFSTAKDFENVTVKTNVVIKTPLVKMWEKEVKEKDGVQEIEYKPLSERFYYLSGQKENRQIQINDQTTTGFYKASTKDTTMPEVVNSRYNQSFRIFTDTRIHEIELALSAYDFHSLDLSKVHYLEQEGQFYILNRVIWESGKLSIGEFLRLKK